MRLAFNKLTNTNKPYECSTFVNTLFSRSQSRYSSYFMLCSSPPDSPADIGEVALKVAQDEANNGCIMEVWSAKDYKYRKRVVVDQDGKSNPIFAEEPLVPQLMKGKK